jgi:AcrR family transcriptional regulator
LPRNKYPEETREKVIDAGLRTFQEKGFEASTILDIVDNMNGLTRGAFYHHFKSKEELLSAICERIFENNNPFDKVRTEKSLNGMEKLRKALKINMARQHSDFSIVNTAGNELFKSPHFFMWHMEFNAELSHKYILPLVKEGIADGSIKEQDPRILAELFVVLFSLWLGSPLFTGGMEYVEKKAMAVFQILESLGLNIYDEDFEELGRAWLANEAK